MPSVDGWRRPGATVSELAGFHHVALTVSDLDASAAWYQRVLGLVEVFREDGNDRRAVVFGFPGGGHAVGLVWHAETTGAFDPRQVGLDHFSFVVERRAALDAWVQHLDDEGVAHSGVVDVPPGAILNFKDPDDIALAIFCDRPVTSESPEAQRVRQQVDRYSASVRDASEQSRADVLVVDDNGVNQRIAVLMLERLGFRADVAADGLEAVEAIAKTDYAAVLMDCQMPGMDGYEATREVRRRLGGRRLPIIAMTANALTEDEGRCRAAGMDEFLTKPVTLEGLAQVLERWIGVDQTSPRSTAANRQADTPLDPTMVAALYELDTRSGDASTLTDLVSAFIGDGRARVEELYTAARSGDHVRVEQVAHSLAGSSASFSAQRVADVCRQLESLAAIGDREAVLALLAHLDESFAEAASALGAEFLSHESPPGT